MVVKKSCVAACPVEWPDGRGISGRMRVEWVAGSAWNRWSDAHGMGGQMTVESAVK
uniref:Type III restriction-modification system methylation subunit n=1 Tax=Pseudomonas aeruginosa TaxID=287 RepID=A0A7S6C7I8_PSEAI|nr:Type III restriction-modification system methylation subunit [Pseudomonas aeruginosa]